MRCLREYLRWHQLKYGYIRNYCCGVQLFMLNFWFDGVHPVKAKWRLRKHFHVTVARCAKLWKRRKYGLSGIWETSTTRVTHLKCDTIAGCYAMFTFLPVMFETDVNQDSADSNTTNLITMQNTRMCSSRNFALRKRQFSVVASCNGDFTGYGHKKVGYHVRTRPWALDTKAVTVMGWTWYFWTPQKHWTFLWQLK